MIYTRSSRSYREIGTAPVTGFGPAGKGTLLGVTPEGRILLFDLATGRTRQGDSLTERLSLDAQSALPAPDGRSLYVIEQPTVTKLWMLTVDDR
jgi:hypothetical protein